ncbi:MAG TPA: hypothetical protein VEC57_19420 [Candidatus Limnocylindrales bacterium]|nr:hypothetical protein [Candidatus Limnocylindrales bacterium]
MESKGLQRLEENLRRLLSQHGQASTRAGQLAAALSKSREEIEKLKAQNFRYKSERAETRKRIDAVIKRLDRLTEVAQPPEAESAAEEES